MATTPVQYDKAPAQAFLKNWPHLTSPAALARADTNNNWVCGPHHDLINKYLLRVTFNKDMKRLGIHMPWQEGKTTLCSEYYPAWKILTNPQHRVILGSHSDQYSRARGAAVRDIIHRHGGPFKVKIRDDTSAKNEWRVETKNRMFDGGMVCCGFGTGIQGRPADEFLIDDLIKDAEQAESPAIKQKQRDWYTTVVFGRLGPGAPVINVCTRWASDDLAGWLYKEQRGQWTVVKLKALPDGKDDPLGRKPGDHIWRRPLDQIMEAKRISGRWWHSCWQQEPQEDHGMLFRPLPSVVDGEQLPGWPTYLDVGDAWRLRTGAMWRQYRKLDSSIILSCDWSLGRKKTSDFTAFIVAALTPDGRVLLLDVLNMRLRDEERARMLNTYCERWNPDLVATDDDLIAQAMLVDFRRYPSIPEVRILPIGNKAKRIRAMAAVIQGENFRIHLPEEDLPWKRELCDQLSGFTGEEGAVDDMCDALGIIGRLADSLKPNALVEDDFPSVLCEGKQPW